MPLPLCLLLSCLLLLCLVLSYVRAYMRVYILMPVCSIHLAFMPYAFVPCVLYLMLSALRRITIAPPSKYRPNSQYSVIVFLILYLAKSAPKSTIP